MGGAPAALTPTGTTTTTTTTTTTKKRGAFEEEGGDTVVVVAGDNVNVINNSNNNNNTSIQSSSSKSRRVSVEPATTTTTTTTAAAARPTEGDAFINKATTLPEAKNHRYPTPQSEATTTTTTTTTTMASRPPPSVPSSIVQVPRYLLRIQYDGTNFHGFQRQQNGRTVQGCVEEALAKFAGVKDPVPITGSSRTDAGVHATDSTAHVDLARTSKRHPGKVMPPHPPDTVMRAVNHFLKKTAPDACISAVIRVDPMKFHARFSATGRTYHYRMHVSPTPPSIFEQGKVWHVAAGNGTGVHPGKNNQQKSKKKKNKNNNNGNNNKASAGDGGGGNGDYSTINNNIGDGDGDGEDWGGLDIDAMRDAASRLLGTHDFSSFRARGCQATSPIRTLTSVTIEQTPTWPPFPEQEEDTDDFSDVLPPSHAGDKEEEEEEEEAADDMKDGRGGKKARKEGNDGGGGGHGRSLVRGGVVITFEGPSFLYHQVRLMVATLRAVGAGEIAPDQMQTLLDKKNPDAVPPMAPACGLYLAKVHYDGTRKWAPRFPNDMQQQQHV